MLFVSRHLFLHLFIWRKQRFSYSHNGLIGCKLFSCVFIAAVIIAKAGLHYDMKAFHLHANHDSTPFDV